MLLAHLGRPFSALGRRPVNLLVGLGYERVLRVLPDLRQPAELVPDRPRLPVTPVEGVELHVPAEVSGCCVLDVASGVVGGFAGLELLLVFDVDVVGGAGSDVGGEVVELPEEGGGGRERSRERRLGLLVMVEGGERDFGRGVRNGEGSSRAGRSEEGGGGREGAASGKQEQDEGQHERR